MEDLEYRIKSGTARVSRRAQKEVLTYYVQEIVNKEDDIDQETIAKNNLLLNELLFNKSVDAIDPRNYEFDDDGKIDYIIGLELDLVSSALVRTPELYINKVIPQ